MGTTSSAAPGSSILPAPSRPEDACLPQLPPGFSLPEATSQRTCAGAQRSWFPFAGVSPVGGPVSPSSHRQALCSSPNPSRLHLEHCPAPTAGRKDAAWVPCQASECAAPPSRARNAAGPRGRRAAQTPGTQASRPCHTGSQAGGLSSLRPGFLLEEKHSFLPSLRFETWSFVKSC